MDLRKQSAWRTRTPRQPDLLHLRTWLHDRGSLTARLQAKGRFSLRVVRQQLALPTPDEAAELGIKRHVLVRVREVALSVDNQVMVFAHTILPGRPHGPVTGWLARLGNHSLGAMLFSHPGFSRGTICCKRLDQRHPLYDKAIACLSPSGNARQALWARRSRFVYGSQQILVTEVFSPLLGSDPVKC